MMNFKDFCDTVEKNVSHYLPSEFQGAKIQVQKNRKVNLGYKVGVSMCMPGQSVGPVVYLNPYYKEVSLGEKTMGQALEGIAMEGTDALRQLKNNEIGGFDPSSITVWSAMKEKIYMSAVGLTRNEELLSNVPHREMGDIACTYRIHLKGPDGSDGTILVNNQMMDGFKVTEEQLFQTAVANTLEKTPPTLNRMSDVAASMMDPSRKTGESSERLLSANMLDLDRLRDGQVEEQNWWEKEPEQDKSDRNEDSYRESRGRSIDDDIPLYVLTTAAMTQGAAVVFVPNVLEQIQQKMPEGFFVLPSSIHEVMIVPKTLGSDPRQLDEMISDINETQVDPEEQLSDLCHEYDADRKRLICPTAPELNKVKDEEPELDPGMSL